MAVANVYIGNSPNDGTGDPIRSAFNTVNSNFATLNNYLYQGIFPTIVNQLGILAENVTSNTFVSAATLSGSTLNAGNATVTGNSTVNGFFTVGGKTILGGDLQVAGNIFYGGAGSQLSTEVISDSKIYLHANTTPWTVDDGSDIGIVVNYYKGAAKSAFFGWANDSSSWEFYANGQVATNLSGGNVFVGNTLSTPATYGTLKIGEALLVNTTPATSSVTGALTVAGGVGVAGNVYAATGFHGNLNVDGNVTYIVSTSTAGGGTNVKGNLNLNGADGIYINGAGVLTGIGAGGGTINGATNFTNNITVNGTIYGTLGNASQTNITAVGQLVSLAVTGTTTVRDVIPDLNNQYQIGQAGQVFANVRATNLYGTLQTPNQNQITSATSLSQVGQLISLGVTGNVVTGGVLTNNYYYANGVSMVDTVNSLWAANTAGLYTSTAAYQTWANANLSTQTTNINTINANIGTYQILANANAATQHTTINTIQANLGAFQTYANTTFGTSNYGNANVAAYLTTHTGNVRADYIQVTSGIISTGSSPAPFISGFSSISTTGSATNEGNITASGNLVASRNAYITGNVNAGNVIIANHMTIAGNVTITGITTLTGNILPSANLSVDLGSSTKWFNSVYGKSVQAQYADLAEMYTSDAEYEPGTVLIFGGGAEVTTTNTYADSRVAGVVSTEPAYLMNSMTDGVAIALRGRVPVKVIGTVSKGDLLVTSETAGYAISVRRSRDFGSCVFAKAIEDSDDNGPKIIEAVII
jgi:cytoskeletal protein CcmA (bactofilin family)